MTCATQAFALAQVRRIELRKCVWFTCASKFCRLLQVNGIDFWNWFRLTYASHFWISIRSEGSDTPEEATESKVKSKRLLFVPGPNIHDMIQRIPVEEYGLRTEI